jgi:cell division protein ZapA (FtsZ GTPase activity inhibitor)
MEDNTINITVLIAGRPYPLKVRAEDEPNIRRLVKDVNDMINRFQGAYHNRDKQDFLAMSLLTYAVELHKAKQEALPRDAADRLEQVDKLLSYLVGQ